MLNLRDIKFLENSITERDRAMTLLFSSTFASIKHTTTETSAPEVHVEALWAVVYGAATLALGGMDYLPENINQASMATLTYIRLGEQLQGLLRQDLKMSIQVWGLSRGQLGARQQDWCLCSSESQFAQHPEMTERPENSWLERSTCTHKPPSQAPQISNS